MQYEPSFSIIINCYNSEKFIKETIESVLRQSYIHFEVIVWDNLSTDKTLEVVSEFQDTRIKIFIAKTHASLGIARNMAISKAKNQYLAFIDSDDLWESNKLAVYAKELIDSKHGSIVLFSNSYLIDGDSNRIGKIYTKKKPVTTKRQLLLNYNLSLETLVVPKEIVEMNYITFGDYNIIEEFDFVLRLSKFCDIIYIDGIYSSWRIHDNQLSQTKELDYPIELMLWTKSVRGMFNFLDLWTLRQLAIIKYILTCKKLNIKLDPSVVSKFSIWNLLSLIPYQILLKIKKSYDK
jgi:glycosyltransferase involved in cell wall biosynthesis